MSKYDKHITHALHVASDFYMLLKTYDVYTDRKGASKRHIKKTLKEMKRIYHQYDVKIVSMDRKHVTYRFFINGMESSYE